MRIDGNARTVRELLANTKYTLDYYQREYSWQTRHVTDFIDDLTGKFLEDYSGLHERSEVPKYGHYYLGAIIISHTDGRRSIVDGQQRLTTLTLLLIHLRHLLGDTNLRSQVDPLIYSLVFGVEGFNLDVPQWEPVLNALYSGDSFDAIDESESIRNIAASYNDIENHFELPEQAIPFFAEWLLVNVYLIEIAAFDDRDAYEIFETVNDRGLSLTPADMLRGYLLSHITESSHRDAASEVWSNRVRDLQGLGREEVTSAIKAWLRSQYAQSMRDFDRIGSEFHRWIRDQETALGLVSSEDFAAFIQRDFAFYSQWYYRLQKAAKSLTPDWYYPLRETDANLFNTRKPAFECVYYNAHQKFTLQFPVLLAPLQQEDSDEEIIRKIQIVSRYLDIFIHRHIWNFRPVSQNVMTETIFSVIQDIRGKSPTELAKLLNAKLTDSKVTFASNDRFQLQGNNRARIRHILARITDYVGIQSNQPPRFLEYFRTGENAYEVEHIWADYPERHTDEFSHEIEFKGYRNHIGGLLLLPKDINASYGNDPYEEKREHYRGQNLLAASLHEQTYERNPGFLRFVRTSGLPFRAHAEFRRADLDARQRLYQHLAEQIWSPERLLGEDPPPFIPPPEEPYDPDPPPVPGLADPGLDERTRSEVREFYSGMSASKVSQLCERVVELHRLIEEEGWELTRKFNQSYCAFYLGNRRVFGVSFFAYPRLAAWITKAEAENLSCHSNFESYYDLHRHAVYPQGTTVDQLRPIFEFAYRKYRGN